MSSQIAKFYAHTSSGSWSSVSHAMVKGVAGTSTAAHGAAGTTAGEGGGSAAASVTVIAASTLGLTSDSTTRSATLYVSGGRRMTRMLGTARLRGGR